MAKGEVLTEREPGEESRTLSIESLRDQLRPLFAGVNNCDDRRSVSVTGTTTTKALFRDFCRSHLRSAEIWRFKE